MGSSRLRHRTNQKPPLCKGQRSGGAVVNDMPVVYQSRAVTEPQREVARRSRDGGIVSIKFHLTFGVAPTQSLPCVRGGVSRLADGGVAGTNYGNSFISPVGGAKSPQGDSLYAYPAGGYFSMKKSNQKSFKAPP